MECYLLELVLELTLHSWTVGGNSDARLPLVLSRFGDRSYRGNVKLFL